MLARVPWTPKPETKPKPKRLTKARKAAIREKIVIIMRAADPTPFAAEGPCRYGIRSSLCLEGWSWAEADAVAQEIVKAALNIVGAHRPTWQQGQPWWTEQGVTAIERTRCIRCHGPLPEDHRKYCSDLCKAADYQDKARNDDRAAYNAAMQAYRSAKRNRKNADAATAA